jgi:CheY-like chemotaxis protein
VPDFLPPRLGSGQHVQGQDTFKNRGTSIWDWPIGVKVPKYSQGKYMETDLTILIAEDTETDAELVKIALRSIGVKNSAEIVPDGQAVIDYLCGTGKYHDRAAFPFPSILFVDLKMPRVNGFELLRWLKDHPECSIIPVIVLSSSKTESDVTMAYQLGANAYLMKPANLDDLKAMLRTTLEFWDWCCKPAVPKTCED